MKVSRGGALPRDGAAESGATFGVTSGTAGFGASGGAAGQDASGGAAGPDVSGGTAASARKTVALRWTAAVLGVAFVVIGVARGEHLEVLSKAVRVCLECIGIG